MLILLAITELLQSLIRRILHWFIAPSRPPYGQKRARAADRHNHCHSKQKPDWLKQEIIRLKANMPQAGCRSIADICNRRFAASRNITVGKTYVHQVLQQHDYEIQILRRNLKHVKPKSVRRNLIWGIDLTGKTNTLGCLHFIFGIIDHGSRALLHLQALHDKTTGTLLNSLHHAIQIYGKPRVIRTDNEGMFRSPAFTRALKQLGIRHQLTDPGCPWQNGRIERLFGTLKVQLDQWQVPNFSQLNIGAGNDQLYVFGAGNGNRLDGGADNDILQGADGEDHLGWQWSCAEQYLSGTRKRWRNEAANDEEWRMVA